MIRHYYGGVDYYAERNGYAGKGIYVDRQVEDVVEDDRHENVYRKSGCNYEKVAPGMTHGIYERQEYQHTEKGS